jgi:uncharacterized protein
MDWTLAATGMLIATLVTLTGVGGGSLMTPTLMFGFGLPAATAVGTDLLYAVFTKSGALLSYARDRRVHWSAVGWMLAGSAPAVVLATALLALFHGAALQERFIRVAVGVALILSALSMVLRRRGDNIAGPRPAARPVWLGFGGALIGTLVVLSSIGAGTLGTALLTRLYPRRPLREIVGTELAQAVPLAALAAGGHFLLGQVDWRVAFDLALGAVPGIWLGRRLVHRLPDKWLRYTLAVVLTGAATKLIV